MPFRTDTDYYVEELEKQIRELEAEVESLKVLTVTKERDEAIRLLRKLQDNELYGDAFMDARVEADKFLNKIDGGDDERTK